MFCRWEFTKLLTKIRKIFLNFKPKNLQINKAKSTFLKQISLKSDINYCNNYKIPIFHEKLRCKSNLKLLKILRICVRSFVNSHPGEPSSSILAFGISELMLNANLFGAVRGHSNKT